MSTSGRGVTAIRSADGNRVSIIKKFHLRAEIKGKRHTALAFLSEQRARSRHLRALGDCRESECGTGRSLSGGLCLSGNRCVFAATVRTRG